MALAVMPPPVSAAIVAVHPQTIRIGSVQNNYVYRLQVGTDGVYRCDRRSDWGAVGERLFLFMNTEGPGP